MELTKEQALIEHRKLWNWLADESLKQKRKVIKEEYFTEFCDNYDNIPRSNCWCCEYATAENYFRNCGICPIRWDGITGNHCLLSSSFEMWADVRNTDYKEAARLARIIANLPASEDQND